MARAFGTEGKTDGGAPLALKAVVLQARLWLDSTMG